MCACVCIAEDGGGEIVVHDRTLVGIVCIKKEVKHMLASLSAGQFLFYDFKCCVRICSS